MNKPKNAAEVYLSKWTVKSDTYRTMHGALDRIAAVLGEKTAETYPWASVRFQDAVAVPARLLDAGLAPRTVNKLLAALRGVLDAAWRMGQIPDEEYRRIEIKNLKGDAEAAGKAITPADAIKFRAALPLVSVRDAALMAVLRACGLRRIEAVRLKKESYDPRGVIRAHGKRDKRRAIPVGADWKPWIEAHWQTVKPGGFLFVSERGGRPLDRQSVNDIVGDFCRAAGISYTPHDLRRSFATGLLAAGVDLMRVRRLMGHENLQTTSIYDKRGEDGDAQAVELIK